jgi:hypothetical protein
VPALVEALRKLEPLKSIAKNGTTHKEGGGDPKSMMNIE